MMKKRSKPDKSRYLIVGIGFCVICFVFIIVLLLIQLKGTTLPPREEGYTRTYTVPGIRGEIYDRNGKALVVNSDRYDLIYEYGAMPDTRTEVNKSLLLIMKAIEETDNTANIAEDDFILEGTYPNMRFNARVKNKESNEYYHYQKFLANQKMNESKTDASDIQKYFVKRYKLYDTLYSDEEITTLIRLYYEMERTGFGAYQAYTIATGISNELVTKIEETNIEGVNFDVRPERVYKYPGIASHILGRLGKITAENVDYYLEQGYALDAYVGTSGCEEAFEQYLRGTDGEMYIKYDKDGNMVEKGYLVEPKSGNDVYLTIDIELQIAAEKALADNVAMIESSDAGAVTVLDPNSASVLAIASYPTFDLSRFGSIAYYNSLAEDKNLPLYNRALQGVYAPGSTYKIGVAMAALEQHVINENNKYTCNEIYFPGGPTCLDSHGDLNVIGAIRESCNIFFYNLGETMGIDSITTYTKRLGLGVESGFELGTKNGIVAGPAYRESIGTQWMPGDDLSAAIGQSDHGYTPLQMSVYMSSVVNGGTRYSAHLLDSVRKFHTKEIVKKTEIQKLDELTDEEYSEHTREILVEAMRQVVTDNATISNVYFKNLPVKAGGKTGTAEVSGKIDYAVFTGFAPLDYPEIVVTCILEEGKYGYLAAYTVGKVMEAYFEAKAAEQN